MAEEQDEATKVEARQFMSNLLSSGNDAAPTMTGPDMDMSQWKATYKAKSSDENEAASLMQKFWDQHYDPTATSIWTMVYDEADSNENLTDTQEIVHNFLTQPGMQALSNHCFGVVHVLETLEIEGLWIFNGPDPELLFGANDETSWFSFTQLGPEANEYVKKAVTAILTPVDGKLHGKVIKDTQTFA